MASNVADVAGSFNTTWYLTKSGDLYGAGSNSNGEQGAGNTTDVHAFTKRASGVKFVIATVGMVWYINNSNELYGCGFNGYGQQGSGNTTNVTKFTKRASNVKEVKTCTVYSFGTTETVWYLTNSNELYGCGSNESGQQGANSTTNVTKFTKRASNVASFDCSYTTTWYIDQNGNLYGCGDGEFGQQGSNSTADVKTFTRRDMP